jgi:hypothetical protein
VARHVTLLLSFLTPVRPCRTSRHRHPDRISNRIVGARQQQVRA